MKDVGQIIMIGRLMRKLGRGVMLHLGAAILSWGLVAHLLDGPAWGALIGCCTIGLVILCVAPFAPKVRPLPTQHLGVFWGTSIVILVTSGFALAIACESGSSIGGLTAVWMLTFGVSDVMMLRAAERQTVQLDDAAGDAAHRS